MRVDECNRNYIYYVSLFVKLSLNSRSGAIQVPMIKHLQVIDIMFRTSVKLEHKKLYKICRNRSSGVEYISVLFTHRC
jgi:hypothetical protein